MRKRILISQVLNKSYLYQQKKYQLLSELNCVHNRRAIEFQFETHYVVRYAMK